MMTPETREAEALDVSLGFFFRVQSRFDYGMRHRNNAPRELGKALEITHRILGGTVGLIWHSLFPRSGEEG